MPRGVYSIKCNKKYKITDDFEPADHQKFVTKYFEKRVFILVPVHASVCIFLLRTGSLSEG